MLPLFDAYAPDSRSLGDYGEVTVTAFDADYANEIWSTSASHSLFFDPFQSDGDHRLDDHYDPTSDPSGLGEPDVCL